MNLTLKISLFFLFAFTFLNHPFLYGQNCSSTAVFNQDLPLVTHWSQEGRRVEGASDQYPLYSTNLKDPNQPHRYIYNFNFLPTAGNYIGNHFSVNAISNEEALAWIHRLCQSTKQDYQFWQPKTYGGSKAIDDILARAPQNSGRVLVISGLTNSKSMFALFLPGNWHSRSAKNSFPIVFNGYYDLNDNLIRQEGFFVGEFIGKSTKDNGSGAIGILWNGAGAIGSRSVNPQVWEEFQGIMDLVSRLGGDPHRILSFGASRGGLTPLQLASNPHPHNYTFRYIDSAVPPAHLGTVSRMATPTIAMLIQAMDWSVGFSDAYKKSFVYPDLGNGFAGLNNFQSHLKVITGVSDPKLADEEFSLGSPPFIKALKQAGSQIYLELASHDNYVPSFDQLWLYLQYKEAGVPVELQLNYLAGHYSAKEMTLLRFEKQLRLYTHEKNREHPKVNKGSQHFYQVDSANLKLAPLESKEFLFTLEVPRLLSPEVAGVIVSTGIPFTKVELSLKFPDGKITTYMRELNKYAYDIYEFDPKNLPTGRIEVVQVRIKKPNTLEWKNISLSHRTYKMSEPSEPLVIENFAEHPSDWTGEATTHAILSAYLGSSREKALPYFLGVTYGIIESAPKKTFWY